MTRLHDLHTLATRLGCGVASDVAAMNMAQLWVLHAFLKAWAEGG